MICESMYTITLLTLVVKDIFILIISALYSATLFDARNTNMMAY